MSYKPKSFRYDRTPLCVKFVRLPLLCLVKLLCRYLQNTSLSVQHAVLRLPDNTIQSNEQNTLPFPPRQLPILIPVCTLLLLVFTGC